MPQNKQKNSGRLPPPKEYQFKKGQSGNPGGRPKKLPVTDRYREVLEMQLPDEECKKLGLKLGSRIGDGIALAVAKKGFSGDTSAAKEIRESIEGKAKERLEISGIDGGPVEVRDARAKLLSKLAR